CSRSHRSATAGAHRRTAVGRGALHVGHGHGAVATGATDAADIDLELARLCAHGGHGAHAAHGHGLFAAHGVRRLHGADHGTAVAALAAGLALRRGFAALADRPAVIGCDDLVVRRRVLAADAVSATAVVVAGVLALRTLREAGIDLGLGQHRAGGPPAAGGACGLPHRARAPPRHG